MKLYLISQDYNNGYDTYDSAVVCAENEDEAKNFHPNGYRKLDDSDWNSVSDTWTTIDQVKVKYIGEAKDDLKEGVVCSSFNAG